MILYFANRHMQILGMAATTLPSGYVIIEDQKTEDIETGVAVFSCRIEFDKSTRLLLEEMTNAGNYLLRSNGEESEFYTIIDTEIDTKNQDIYIYAEDAGLDLINEIATEYEAPAEYAAHVYIKKYINDSGFEIGINEINPDDKKKLSWDSEETVTGRLASIAQQFGGYEISYSFEIEGLEIKHKYINIHKERGNGADNNIIQLRLNREIDRIITTKSVANIATALICEGGVPDKAEEPITLMGYRYDDGDLYVGDDGILRSREAVKKWSRYVWNNEPNQLNGYAGHILRPFSYNTTSQKELCARARAELQKLCDMEINYEVDISRLPTDIKIGDRINIIDDAGEMYVSSRILMIESSVTDGKHKVTLGEHLIKDSGISSKVNEMAEQFAKTAQSAAKAMSLSSTAKADAVVAKESAGEALTLAGTAAEGVGQVQTLVAIVKTTAEDAQTAAVQAKADAEDAHITALIASEEAGQAQQEASEAAAVAVLAQTSINNLKIGGENLLRDTDFENTAMLHVRHEGDSTEEGFLFGESGQLESGKEYTLSARIRGNTNVDMWEKNDYSDVYYRWIDKESLSEAEYRHFSITFTASEYMFFNIFIATRYGEENTAIGDWFEIAPKSLKLEEGNKATDWSPAQHDVSEDIGEAQATANDAAERITTAESLIQQLADSISMLVRGENGGTLLKQDESGFYYFDVSELLKDISENADGLSEIEGLVRTANGDIDVLKSTAAALQQRTEYIKNGVDENDQPYIELGEGDSAFKVKITNTSIQFSEGTETPAQINRKMLIIEKTMIKNELQFGDDEEENSTGVWLWKRRSNGNLGLMWKGVSG